MLISTNSRMDACTEAVEGNHCGNYDAAAVVVAVAASLGFGGEPERIRICWDVRGKLQPYVQQSAARSKAR